MYRAVTSWSEEELLRAADALSYSVAVCRSIGLYSLAWKLREAQREVNVEIGRRVAVKQQTSGQLSILPGPGAYDETIPF